MGAFLGLTSPVGRWGGIPSAGQSLAPMCHHSMADAFLHLEGDWGL